MTPQIRWLSPLFDFSAEALFARSLVPALEALGVQCCVDPSAFACRHTNFGRPLEYWQKRLETKLPGAFTVLVVPDLTSKELPSLISRTDPQALFVTALPVPIEPVLKEMFAGRQVWVPSSFSAQALQSILGTDVQPAIVRPGIDCAHFNPANTAPLPLAGLRDFNFLSLFHWRERERKGLDILLRAFLQAFGPQDSVSLMICTSCKADEQAITAVLLEEYIERLGLDLGSSSVILYDDFLPEEHLPSLYRTADAFVLPCRCAGFGSAVVEAASMELPLIVPQWSGTADFTSAQFIPVERGTGFYAEPSAGETARLMRNLFENRTQARLNGIQARAMLTPEWTIQTAAETVLKQAEQAQRPASFSVPPLKQPEAPSNGGRPKNGKSRVEIAVDGRTFTYLHSTIRGIGHYSLYHMESVLRETPDWHYTLYLEEVIPTRETERLGQFPNVSFASYNRTFGGKNGLSADLFHIPDPLNLTEGFDCPFRLAPPELPKTAVFYDLIPLVQRESYLETWMPGVQASYRSRLERVQLSHSHLFAISEHTKKDLMHYLNIASGQITSILAGLNTKRAAPPAPTEIQSVRTKFGLNLPFFLVVGSLDPHKNFSATINAFGVACTQMPLQLVVVGSLEDPFKRYYQSNFEKRGIRNVIFTDYITRDELEALYASAQGLVFPSYYEGFGFPVLEAMARGCPVACSDAASLPEVGGQAVLHCAPDDVDRLATLMLVLTKDQNLRADLIQRGYQQAAKFTWQKTAQKTIAVWERMLGCKAEHYGSAQLAAAV